MNIYCNNCGIKGHVYKDCLSPILSCGIILCKPGDDSFKVLMINRKDSLCYIDFLRGKYNINDVNYIQILLDKMTIQEKDKLLNIPYDKLWCDLWMLDELTEKLKGKNDYKDGSKKLSMLKGGLKINEAVIYLNELIERSECNYKETEWEFPKGRRNKHEKNKECAIREVGEETNYMISDYNLITNVSPIIEEFCGENKIKYKYIYYLGILKNIQKECRIDKNNLNQIQEINNIGWFTKSEALNKLRDYHKSRELLINTLYGILDSVGKDLFFL